MLIVKSPHYARFECPEGGATFSIHLAKALLGESAVVYFENEDLDNKVRSLEAQGIEFEMQARSALALGGGMFKRSFWKFDHSVSWWRQPKESALEN